MNTHTRCPSAFLAAPAEPHTHHITCPRSPCPPSCFCVLAQPSHGCLHQSLALMQPSLAAASRPHTVRTDGTVDSRLTSLSALNFCRDTSPSPPSPSSSFDLAPYPSRSHAAAVLEPAPGSTTVCAVCAAPFCASPSPCAHLGELLAAHALFVAPRAPRALPLCLSPSDVAATARASPPPPAVPVPACPVSLHIT